MLFAGVDVSTQSCKLLVIDLDKNETVFLHTVNYDQDLPKYKTKNGVRQNAAEGVSESDPHMWIEALDMVFAKLKASDVLQDDIRCIAVSGQQHGLVALDEKGNLTRPYSKLWNDFSTGEECDLLTQAVGGTDAMIAEVGNSQRTGYTAPKILHMFRHESENYHKTKIFFLVHNYINWYLTGGVAVMEPGDTSGMALWHPGKGSWSEKVIRAIDASLIDKLPPVQAANTSIGVVSAEIARKYGLNPACRIDAGSGDNMYGAVGTGNTVPGIVTISLGTSGTAYTYLNEPFIDASGEIAAFADSTGAHLPLLCVSNLANGYNQIIGQYNLSHEQFNDIVRKTPPGNKGRTLIPWYEGERTPDVPQAAPVYFGFGLEEFTKENLCRAVLEGHILNLYDGFRRLPVQTDEIRLTGGLSQSPAWRQTIADVFNCQTVPVEGEGAALGAALHAAWVWLREEQDRASLQDISTPFIKLSDNLRHKPIAENVEVYEQQKQLFQGLSERVRTGTKNDPFMLRSRLLHR